MKTIFLAMVYISTFLACDNALKQNKNETGPSGMKGWSTITNQSSDYGYFFIDSIEYYRFLKNDKLESLRSKDSSYIFLIEDSLFYASSEYENLISHYETMYAAFNVDFLHDISDEISKRKDQLKRLYSIKPNEFEKLSTFYSMLNHSFGSENNSIRILSLPLYLNTESLERVQFKNKLLHDLLVKPNLKTDHFQMANKHFEIFTESAVYRKLLRSYSFQRSPIQTSDLDFHDHFIINFFLHHFQSGKFLVRLKK